MISTIYNENGTFFLKCKDGKGIPQNLQVLLLGGKIVDRDDEVMTVARIVHPTSVEEFKQYAKYGHSEIIETTKGLLFVLENPKDSSQVSTYSTSTA